MVYMCSVFQMRFASYVWCVYECFVDFCFFFFKQKTAYEMRISYWSSDVCSSDLPEHLHVAAERYRAELPTGLRPVGEAEQLRAEPDREQIGRASCRERVGQNV